MAKAPPAVALAGVLNVKLVTAAGLTLMVVLVEDRPAVTLSVAVIVWFPAVMSVALKTPDPLVSVALAGRTALESLLLKLTVPEYAVVGAPLMSSAVTVTLNAVPAMVVAGTVKEK